MRETAQVLECHNPGWQVECTVWTYMRVGCPFCLSKEAQSCYPAGDGLYRLYLCPACGRYLKTVDLRAAGRPNT